MASSAEISTQFNTFVCLDDSLLQLLELKTGDAECSLKFQFANILKAPGGSPYDPRVKFEPARISFRGVRSMMLGGEYQLNSNVVGCRAEPTGDGEHVDFSFDLTGGTDPEAFLVTVTITAATFDVTAWDETEES
ncbi:MAG: hypothetical protein K0V04_38580 [Deltaproteobacteria bacterium]|nr:hypothetical protein [Deltaproteobacteria bacterium]